MKNNIISGLPTKFSVIRRLIRSAIPGGTFLSSNCNFPEAKLVDIFGDNIVTEKNQDRIDSYKVLSSLHGINECNLAIFLKPDLIKSRVPLNFIEIKPLF